MSLSARITTRPVVFYCAAMGFVLVFAGIAFSLDTSKLPSGANHQAAHAISTGQNSRIGVVEAGVTGAANNGIDIAKYHFVGRLSQNRYFGGAVPPLAALPPAATGAKAHGTLVSDVAASDHAVYTGVSKAGLIYAAWEDSTGGNDLSDIQASLDGYQRLSSVYLFNNSYYVAQPDDNGANQNALFFDWFASKRDVLLTKSAGNNGPGSGNGDSRISQPGDAHNVITVGAVDENFTRRVTFSSYWLSGDNGASPDIRGKPDIVAPGGSDNVAVDPIESDAVGNAKRIADSGTSFATPHVTGVCGMLMQQGLALPGPAGRNRLAHKAIILNSARKRRINAPIIGFPIARDNAATGNQESDYDYLNGAVLRVGGTQVGGTPKSDEWTPAKWDYNGALFTTLRPLDDELGTGVLDAERALTQHAPGEQVPGNVGPIGWNRDSISAALPDDIYILNFQIQAGTFITTTLTWDRNVTETQGNGNPGNNSVENTDVYSNTGGNAASVPDLDLKIYKSGNPPVLIARSIGVGGAGIGENVEHLHIPVSETGMYEIHVNATGGAALTDYAVAWWTVQAIDSIPSVSQWGLIIMTLIILTAATIVISRRQLRFGLP